MTIFHVDFSLLQMNLKEISYEKIVIVIFFTIIYKLYTNNFVLSNDIFL